jgi:hypothetical protein
VGLVFPVRQEDFKAVVDAVRDLKNGRLAFRVEMNFGIGGKLDKVAVLEETDQFKLLEIMHVQGNDFTIANKDVIAHFRGWEKQFRFHITGVGFDFIEAEFIDAPKDFSALAQEIYAVCPDVVDQGTDTVGALAAEMRRTNSMFFWWD